MFEPPDSQVDPELARRTADEVLAGRAYVDADQPPSIPERALDWIVDVFADALSSLSSPGGRGLFAWLVILGFLVIIVALLVRLVRNFERLPASQASVSMNVDVHEGRSSREWLAAAEEAERAGNWRLAVRNRHRALVARLTARGVVSPAPGATAGEILRSASAHSPAVEEPLTHATRLFKDSWYGASEADRSTSERFALYAAEVLAASESVPERQPA